MSTTITIVVDGHHADQTVRATAVGDDADPGPAPAEHVSGQASQEVDMDGAGPPPRPEMSGVGTAGGGMSSATESAPAPSLDPAQDAGDGADMTPGPAPQEGAVDADTAESSAAPEPVALEDLD
jgi:hypothetical protein